MNEREALEILKSNIELWDNYYNAVKGNVNNIKEAEKVLKNAIDELEAFRNNNK